MIQKNEAAQAEIARYCIEKGLDERKVSVELRPDADGVMRAVAHINVDWRAGFSVPMSYLDTEYWDDSQ